MHIGTLEDRWNADVRREEMQEVQQLQAFFWGGDGFFFPTTLCGVLVFDSVSRAVERRAKARLVVLGFEDPGLSEVPRDAPTLSKDGRQLLLQLVSSHKWDLLNFDISTAFLKGQGDGRPLGIHPPEELSTTIGMETGDQCLLRGGAYGRVDAPYLWYCELCKVLESLGFVKCPFDGCLFSLVSEGPKGRPIVHGILGMHVDDGIGGGDAKFEAALSKLKERFAFGAFNKYEFDFVESIFDSGMMGQLRWTRRNT